MPEVIPKGQLLLDHFRSAYPFQTQPNIDLPDISLTAVMGNAADLQGLVPDALVGGVYAEPVFVPHHQRLSGGTVTDNDAYLSDTLPEWQWDSTGTSWHATVSAQCFRAKHYGNQTLDFAWNSNTSPAAATVTLSKVLSEDEPDETLQGFFCFLSRTVYNQVPSGTEAVYEVRWKIDSVLYGVRVSNITGTKFRKSTDDGTTWQDIGKPKTGGSALPVLTNSTPQHGQQQIPLEVLLLNGVLLVKLAGQAVPFQYRVGTARSITKVVVTATCFTQFGVEVHPLKFRTTGSLRSNPHALGFNPDASTPPHYYVAGISGVKRLASGGTWAVAYPAGSNVTVTRSGGATDAEQQYDLEIENAEEGTYNGISYARRTAVVTRVTIGVDGLWAAAATLPVALIPKRIHESTAFDLNSLTIRQQVSFDADNFRGQWRGQAGNIAVQLKLGYQQPLTALFPRFTGMCGKYTFSRPSSHRGLITFHAHDLMRLLEDQIVFAPPVMDGWNHYYAMAFLAQLAGISLSQMAFAALVPSDPYSAAPGDPAPYFLPMGEGMRPWTPRNRESSVLALMDYIRKPTGFLLYFDAQGYLRYEKWIPPALSAQKRYFTEGQTTAGATEGDGLTEYFNLTLCSDIEPVRNQILLLGINPWDPRWSLILNKREDVASIYAAPGSEPKNYVGYKKPFVWVDSRFADATFASQAADRLYEMLRIPGLDVSFEAWAQPDVYPMDVIFVDCHKSGSEGVPFYVLSTDIYWDVDADGRETCRSIIHGRFLI